MRLWSTAGLRNSWTAERLVLLCTAYRVKIHLGWQVWPDSTFLFSFVWPELCGIHKHGPPSIDHFLRVHLIMRVMVMTLILTIATIMSLQRFKCISWGAVDTIIVHLSNSLGMYRNCSHSQLFVWECHQRNWQIISRSRGRKGRKRKFGDERGINE